MYYALFSMTTVNILYYGRQVVMCSQGLSCMRYISIRDEGDRKRGNNTKENGFTIRANRCDDSTRSRQLAISWTSRLPTQNISGITYSFFFFHNPCMWIHMLYHCYQFLHDRVASDCCYSPLFFTWMDKRGSWNSQISQSLLLLMSRCCMNKCILDIKKHKTCWKHCETQNLCSFYLQAE